MARDSARRLPRRGFLGACAAVLGAACRPQGGGPGGLVAWGQSGGLGQGHFREPRAIGVRDGQVYVIDKTGRVQVFDERGMYLRGWTTPDAQNGTPTAVSFAPDGTVLVADTHYSQILEYAPDGTLQAQWGRYGEAPGDFIYPTDVVRAPDGTQYITEYGHNAERLQVFDADRQYLRHWGGAGPEPGQFSRAMALAQAPDGTLYVADMGNNRVQVFAPDGGLQGIIGETGDGPGQLKYPFDLDLAPDGSLLVAEYGNNRISRFTSDGSFLASWGTAGRGPGECSGPRGVAASASGHVFVADTGNDRIVRVPLEAVA